MKIKLLYVTLAALLLTGCPRAGKEGEQYGARRAVFINGNNICFTVDKKETLSRYNLYGGYTDNNPLLVGDFESRTYPHTCFEVHLESGLVYSTSYTLNGKNYYYTFIRDKSGNIIDLARK